MTPAGDAQKPFFTLFHHPFPMSPGTNHFSDVASVHLATVHPNNHFYWDSMNHSVEILAFSLTTDSTQRISLDKKNDLEAAAVRRIPPFVSVSHFILIKENLNNISLPGQDFLKLNTFKECQIAIGMSSLDVRS